jgi:antitoxin component of MazEF toxin-antitoxin module
MIQRTVTHLALVSKSAQSLKTTIPRSVVKKLKLQQSDMLEWLETSKGDIVVRRL